MRHGILQIRAVKTLNLTLVAQLRNGWLNGHATKNRQSKILRDGVKFAFPIDEDFLATIRAFHPAHVLHDAQHRHIHGIGHVVRLADNQRNQVLGRGDDDDAIDRNGLEHGQRNIAGSGWHVEKEKVEVSPQYICPKLLDRVGDDGATPDDWRIFLFQKQVDGHDPNIVVRSLRENTKLVARGFFMNAEHFWDGRSRDIRIQHTHLVAQPTHRHREHRSDQRFADATFSADHTDDLLDSV